MFTSPIFFLSTRAGTLCCLLFSGVRMLGCSPIKECEHRWSRRLPVLTRPHVILHMLPSLMYQRAKCRKSSEGLPEFPRSPTRRKRSRFLNGMWRQLCAHNPKAPWCLRNKVLLCKPLRFGGLSYSNRRAVCSDRLVGSLKTMTMNSARQLESWSNIILGVSARTSLDEINIKSLYWVNVLSNVGRSHSVN